MADFEVAVMGQEDSATMEVADQAVCCLKVTSGADCEVKASAKTSLAVNGQLDGRDDVIDGRCDKASSVADRRVEPLLCSGANEIILHKTCSLDASICDRECGGEKGMSLAGTLSCSKVKDAKTTCSVESRDDDPTSDDTCDGVTSDDASRMTARDDEVTSDDASSPMERCEEDETEDDKGASKLLKSRNELRIKMLLGWGSSVSMGVVAGLHMCADSWFGTQTYSRVSSLYLAVFLSCFAFATYTDNVEAFRPRSRPSGEAKELNFWKNATPQHYSWIMSLVVAVTFPLLVATGIVKTERRLSTGLVWIAPSLIMRLAVGMSAILHRFVSHRAYEPRNRLVQFALCWVGCMVGQGSPIF